MALFIPSQIAIVMTAVPTLPVACGAVHAGASCAYLRSSDAVRRRAPAGTRLFLCPY